MNKFLKEVIKECKKNKVPFNYHVEDWTAVIIQILCAIAAISSLIIVIVLIAVGCK